MPPLPLAKILNVALPSLAGEARAVVDVLACKNGLLRRPATSPRSLDSVHAIK